MLGKLAIYSKNGMMTAGTLATVAEIVSHTGLPVMTVTERAKQGYFGPAKAKNGLTAYSADKVNEAIKNGQASHSNSKAGAVPLVTHITLVNPEGK